uniref:Tudor domain-containing protein n=1 Tax=Meloidogyne hapla TaxID=6305 RepID=A0A1I8B2S1_MELHA
MTNYKILKQIQHFVRVKVKINRRDAWLEAIVLTDFQDRNNTCTYDVKIIDRHLKHEEIYQGLTATNMRKSENTLKTYKKGDMVEMMDGDGMYNPPEKWVKAEVSGIVDEEYYEYYELIVAEGEQEGQSFNRFPYELRNTLETFKDGEERYQGMARVLARVLGIGGGYYHLELHNGEIPHRLPNEIRRPIGN